MKAKLFIVGLIVSFNTGCNSISNALNPFYDPPSAIAQLGHRDDRELYNDGEGKGQEGKPRRAIDALATYQEAHVSSPNKPVVNAAVIRKVWIPDHLNALGDMVPSHYYYLRVKNDDWAVQDAFEIEGQLDRSGGGTVSSSLPFVVGDDIKR